MTTTAEGFDEMPTPTTDHGWIYEALERLRSDMTNQHTRLRDDVNRGFDGMRLGMEGHTDRMDEHSVRLTIIETERKGEAQRAMKHGTWAGILAAAGLTAVIDALKWAASK